jgi:hypothetical protein
VAFWASKEDDQPIRGCCNFVVHAADLSQPREEDSPKTIPTKFSRFVAANHMMKSFLRSTGVA